MQTRKMPNREKEDLRRLRLKESQGRPLDPSELKELAHLEAWDERLARKRQLHLDRKLKKNTREHMLEDQFIDPECNCSGNESYCDFCNCGLMAAIRSGFYT